MERRRAERLTVNLKAERLSCSNDCSVFIENLSETGIHMVTSPSKKADLFIPGSEVEIRFQTSSGELIELQCNVKWAYDNADEDMTNSVGLEIINPPSEYKEFIKNIH